MSARGQNTRSDGKAPPSAELHLCAPVRTLGGTIGRWLAAYLVVLQAVLGGLAAGAVAAPAAGDAFTLCLSAASAVDGGTDHGGGTVPAVFHDCNACPLAGGVPLLPSLSAADLVPAFAILAKPPVALARSMAPVPLSENARPRAPPRQG